MHPFTMVVPNILRFSVVTSLHTYGQDADPKSVAPDTKSIQQMINETTPEDIMDILKMWYGNDEMNKRKSRSAGRVLFHNRNINQWLETTHYTPDDATNDLEVIWEYLVIRIPSIVGDRMAKRFRDGKTTTETGVFSFVTESYQHINVGEFPNPVTYRVFDGIDRSRLDKDITQSEKTVKISDCLLYSVQHPPYTWYNRGLVKVIIILDTNAMFMGGFFANTAKTESTAGSE